MKHPLVISLFDESGFAVKPWIEYGYRGVCYDILNDGRTENGITFIKADLTEQAVLEEILNSAPSFLSSFPPCTDLTVAGAKHWEEKRRANPNFQLDAFNLVRIAWKVGNALNVPWYIENPIGAVSGIWRKPDFIFDPYEYGGYLPEDDVHPRWPEYIPARDAYRKTTCIWHGKKFRVPPRLKLEIEWTEFNPQTQKLGGKSLKTKMIRSATPRGWAKAVCLANAPWCT